MRLAGKSALVSDAWVGPAGLPHAASQSHAPGPLVRMVVIPSIRAYGCVIMRLSPGQRFGCTAGVLEPGVVLSMVAGQIGEQLCKCSRHIGNAP